MRKRLFTISMILLIYLTACTLPTGASLTAEELEATAVAQTVEAGRTGAGEDPSSNDPATRMPTRTLKTGGSLLLNTPVPTSASGSLLMDTPKPSPTGQPTPTKAPTQASASSSPLTLGTVASNVGLVYYGFCGAQDPTVLGVGIEVQPKSQVASVVLWYEISSHNGSWGPYWKNMTYAAVGDYTAEINIGNDGPSTLVDTGGWVNYWVEATGKNGQTYTSGYFSTNISYCAPGVIGPPAGSAPVINSFTGPAAAAPDEMVTVSWNVSNAPCGVYVDTELVSAVDSKTYIVPAQGAPSQIYHAIAAYGEPCSNPILVSDSFTVQVSQPQVPAAPSGLTTSWNPGPLLVLTWTDNSNNESGFQIWNGSQVWGTSGEDENYWSVGLAGFCGDVFDIRVSAFNSAGASAKSSIISVAAMCVPSPPILSQGAHSAQASVFWTGSGATHYNMYYAGGNLIQEPNYSDTFDFGSYSFPCGSETWVYATAENYAGESSPSNFFKVIGSCP